MIMVNIECSNADSEKFPLETSFSPKEYLPYALWSLWILLSLTQLKSEGIIGDDMGID